VEVEAAAHSHHDHHELPTSGRALDAVAFSATLHCLTGCAIGEVLGMIIGTALGFSDVGTIALAVALAFLFGYSLTSLPLLRAGLALAAVVPIALATDTFSIAVMEIVDNGLMLAIPGAMEAGVGDVLFWGALSVALVIAGVVAFPVNRWLITRGKGHAVLHESGHHPNFPTRLVAIVAGAAFIFGSTVLVAEAVDSDSAGHGGEMAGEPASAAEEGSGEAAEHGGETGNERPASTVAAAPGLSVSDGGLTLELERTELPRATRSGLRFRIVGSDGRAVRDFEPEQEKRMHLIVVRRDTSGFQHLHPRMGRDGTWRTPLTLAQAGSYRVFADFKHEGEKRTLGADLSVDGDFDSRPLPAAATSAETNDGYRVSVDGPAARAGTEATLRFTVSKGEETIRPQRYLGAGGHLVALREGDLAYLHTHPTEGGQTQFATEFPSAGRYRLFFQFKHDGQVRTAAFTRRVSR
jgi:hypothetical protein